MSLRDYLSGKRLPTHEVVLGTGIEGAAFTVEVRAGPAIGAEVYARVAIGVEGDRYAVVASVYPAVPPSGLDVRALVDVAAAEEVAARGGSWAGLT